MHFFFPFKFLNLHIISEGDRIKQYHKKWLVILLCVCVHTHSHSLSCMSVFSVSQKLITISLNPKHRHMFPTAF